MSEMVKVESVDMGAIEQVLVVGDLAKLSPPQRVAYYNRVCDSIGVNPMTRPFEYITLNGKLTLYARKDCTDQLRSRRRVSVRIVAKDRVDDVYVVTARATTPDGREDESTGAVTVAGLKGENMANALMKAETKAKRRVTLSICGLGFTDESEIESIPNARPMRVDASTGEILDTTATVAEAKPLPDLAARIDAANTVDELAAVASEIASLRKSGSLPDALRKTLGERYANRRQALEGAAQ